MNNIVSAATDRDLEQEAKATFLAHKPAWADLECSDLAVSTANGEFAALWSSSHTIGSATTHVTRDDVLTDGSQVSTSDPQIMLWAERNDAATGLSAKDAREAAFALFAAADQLDSINGIEVAQVSFREGDEDPNFPDEPQGYDQYEVDSGTYYKHFVDNSTGEWTVSYVAPKDNVTVSEARELVVSIMRSIDLAERLNAESK